tara:strand:+ start:581 stop:853 length:273 start_codon:yes stop_codon:yes gene_type:complete
VKRKFSFQNKVSINIAVSELSLSFRQPLYPIKQVKSNQPFVRVHVIQSIGRIIINVLLFVNLSDGFAVLISVYVRINLNLGIKLKFQGHY